MRAEATIADKRLVAEYFRRFGLKVDDRHRRHLFIHGTYGQAAAAAGTGFEIRRLKDVRYVHTSSRPHFPSQIAERIRATTLDDGPPMHPGAMMPDFTLLPKYGYTPSDFATFYDAASLYAEGVNGKGENIAMVECSAPDYTYSIGSFENAFGLPMNEPSIVGVDQGGYRSPDYTEYYTATADFEGVDAAAPGASITVYALPEDCTWAEFGDAFPSIDEDMPMQHYVAVSIDYSSSEDFLAAANLQSDVNDIDIDVTDLAAQGAALRRLRPLGRGPPAE